MHESRLTKTLVDEFIKDPIKDIARKATSGVVLYVSGTIAISAGNAIIAVGQVAGSAIAGAAVSAARAVANSVLPTS